MSVKQSHGKISTSILLPVTLALVLLVAVSYVGMKFKGRVPLLQDYSGNIVKKMQLLSDMRASLLISEQAEKSAVMADTDESSKDFADQSRRAADSVDRDRQELQSLLEKDHTSKEMELFKEFDACWTDLRKIDQVILAFAVQNTNLKAAALSFGKGRETMNRFEHALDQLVHSATLTQNRSQIAVLASDAMVAGLNILNLEAPHITESSDEKMSQLEAEMKRNTDIVASSLQELAGLVPDQERNLLGEAKEAFGQFMEVNSEVIRLSRENTNIKSFQLSLGRKRKMAAQCDEILISLQDLVRSNEFKATR